MGAMGEYTDNDVRNLFLKALDQTPPKWASFLAKACADSDLRREVSTLLRAHQRADGFLEQAEPEPEPGPSEGPGGVIGRYKILQEIGKGGFGVVYMAEQTEPVRRKVALKVIKLGMDSEQVVARFEAERQALALMDHANIAKVFDGGTTKRGRPYFVMELVKGVPVTEFCDQAGLSTPDRLALFQEICHAVQHAHQKGIIHRDIKPNNVLVTLHDGKPVPKVIDFGIAKATDRSLTEKTLFTEFHQIIGTPEYMAPEQAEMTSLDVDTRADIYSLGVLLYELLTGAKPFDLKSLLEKGYGEILRTIREVEPPRPSTRLSTLGDRLPVVAKQRHTEAKLLGKIIRGDLDWIVMKALEKDRGHRYDTATAFADDIARYLTDLPVLASPPSRVYRMQKFLRRNRVGVAMAGAMLLVLLTGLGLALWGWSEAAHQAKVATAAEGEAALQRDEARDEAAKTLQILSVLKDMLASASPYEEPDPDYTVRQLLFGFERGLGERLAGRPMVEAAIRITMTRALEDLELLDAADRNLRRARELLGPDPSGIEAEVGEAGVLAGLIQMDRGQHEAAERELRRAVELYRGAAPEDAGGLSAALTTLGSALKGLGRYAEAEKSHREAESIARAMASDPENILPIVLNNLSSALGARMKYEEAECKLREALELYRRVYGREHPYCTLCLNNLAVVLGYQAKHDEALEIAEEVLRQRRLQFPEGHPRIGTALNNLGLIQTNRGEHEMAKAFLEEAYAINEEAHGKEHRATLTTLNNLSLLFFERGKFSDAEKSFRTCLRLRRRVLGEGHPQTSGVMLNLGACLSRQGQLKEAEALLLEAIEASRRALGPKHRQVMAGLAELATLCRRSGRFEEAETHGRRVLEVREAVLGDEHPDVGQALIDLGFVLQARGKFVESVRLLERVKQNALRRRGKDHPNVAVVLENLSLSLSQTEDPGRALAPLKEAYRIVVLAFGAESPRVTRVAIKLGSLHSSLGSYAEGERLMRKLLASQSLPRRPRPSALAVLAQNLLGQGKFKEAETALLESVELRRKTMPKSWLLWNSLSMLGESLAGQSKYDQAEATLLEAYEKMQPPNSSMGRLRKREALERIVEFYKAWGKPREAAAWGAKKKARSEED